ncbi:EamA family transporter [Microbacterium sp. 22242]|uniref:EamA family transporter n=1 Tax=Microbacterium sp. 22242 TaxID=3453896 RepID=UPI003F862DAC
MNPSSPRQQHAIGIALVIGSCLSLPFGAAIAAQLFPALGSWGVTSLRVSIAALVMLVAVRPKVRGWTRRQWIASVLFGLSLAGMNGFFYAAIALIPLGPAVAIEFLGPLVLAAVLTRRAVDGVWVGVAVLGVALLGIDGMIGADALNPLGVLLVLVAAGFWAVYIRLSARVGEVTSGHDGLSMALVVGSVALLPFGIPAVVTVAHEPRWLLPAVLTAILSSAIPYTFELAALRRLPQRVFGVLLALEPAFATLAGFLLLGQHVTPLRLLAVALVIAASVGTTIGSRRTAPPTTGSFPAVPD